MCVYVYVCICMHIMYIIFQRTLIGLEFFCTTIETPEGDVPLLQTAMTAMNAAPDPDNSEERKGCSGRVGKMIFSAGVKQLAIVVYVCFICIMRVQYINIYIYVCVCLFAHACIGMLGTRGEDDLLGRGQATCYRCYVRHMHIHTFTYRGMYVYIYIYILYIYMYIYVCVCVCVRVCVCI